MQPATFVHNLSADFIFVKCFSNGVMAPTRMSLRKPLRGTNKASLHPSIHLSIAQLFCCLSERWFKEVSWGRRLIFHIPTGLFLEEGVAKHCPWGDSHDWLVINRVWCVKHTQAATDINGPQHMHHIPIQLYSTLSRVTVTYIEAGLHQTLYLTDGQSLTNTNIWAVSSGGEEKPLLTVRNLKLKQA